MQGRMILQSLGQLVFPVSAVHNVRRMALLDKLATLNSGGVKFGKRVRAITTK